MKDLINIFLMTVVVLGWAMLEVTGCGYAVLAIPVVYWLKPVLDLLHKNYWVGLAFWGLVAGAVTLPLLHYGQRRQAAR